MGPFLLRAGVTGLAHGGRTVHLPFAAGVAANGVLHLELRMVLFVAAPIVA